MKPEEHAKVLVALHLPENKTHDQYAQWEEACAIMRRELVSDAEKSAIRRAAFTEAQNILRQGAIGDAQNSIAISALHYGIALLEKAR